MVVVWAVEQNWKFFLVKILRGKQKKLEDEYEYEILIRTYTRILKSKSIKDWL